MNSIRNGKSSKSFIAGIFLIIAGLISILMWIGIASLDLLFIESAILPELQSIPVEYTLDELNSGSIKELLLICGSIGFFLSIFTILGGIMSLKKQMWKMALFGGILGILSIGPIFISSILSIIAVILIYISREEFQRIEYK
jgi:hypothetical protein